LVVCLCIGHVVLSDFWQVEINMSAVLVAECFASCDDGGEIRIAMTVAVSHAAAPENLSGVEKRGVILFVSLQLIQQVAELLDEKRIRLGEAPELFGIAVVMAESMTGL